VKHYNTQIFNEIIESRIISELVAFFFNNVYLQSTYLGMTKITDPWQYPEVVDLLEPIMHTLGFTENIGDNFYLHYGPYFPHTDNTVGMNSCNVLIPLMLSCNLPQKFIIFDQVCNSPSGATWTGSVTLPEEFMHNKARSYPYNDASVAGKTEAPNVCNVLQFVETRDRGSDLYNGLSGVAYDWVPGDIIAFPSNRLHCSGIMPNKWKLGLSLRFKYND
jgi:hypothetical protein